MRRARRPAGPSSWRQRRRTAVALLFFGVLAGGACTQAMLRVVQEEAEVVQLAHELLKEESKVLKVCGWAGGRASGRASGWAGGRAGGRLGGWVGGWVQPLVPSPCLALAPHCCRDASLRGCWAASCRGSS